MTDYLNSKNIDEAVNCVREMKAPKHFLPEMLSKIVICSLDCPDEDKEHASTLIHTLRTEGLVTGESFMRVSLPVMAKSFCCKISKVLLFSEFTHHMPFVYFFTGFPQCSGPVSQDRSGHSSGEVLLGPVCGASHHRRAGEHGRASPPSGEWHPLPPLPALSATDCQAEGP